MKKKRSYGILLVFLLLISILVLSGCRQSPVLVQKVYTASAQEVDPDQESKEKDEDADEEEDGNDKHDQDANLAGDSTNSEGQEGEGKKGTTAKKQYDKNGNEDLSAEGSSSGISESDGGLEDEHTDGEDETSSDQEEDSGADIEDDSMSDTSGASESDGEVREITEDANIVAATTQAASIVEMVAGSGHLVATSSDFTSRKAAKLLEDVKSGELKTLWSGDAIDVDKIIAIKDLDTVFYITGELSSDQEKKLTKHGINCVSLNQLNSIDAIENAVQTAGDYFSKSTKKSSVKVANNYIKWVSSVKKDAAKVEETNYTLYVDAWDDTVTYQLKGRYSDLPAQAGVSSSGQGKGAALVPAGKNIAAFNEAIGWTGITNTASQKDAGDEKGYYATPMLNQFAPQFTKNASGYSYYRSNVWGDKFDNFVSHKLGSGTYLCLGDKGFTSLIVGSSETKKAIEDSWFWEAKGVQSGGGVSIPGGYYADGMETPLYGDINKEYDIYVSPTGIGSWSQGSTETPLLAYWISCVYDTGYDKKALKDKVKKFYNDFYDVDISSMVDSMLDL